MPWVDAHAHLNSPEFAADLDATVARARAAGVERFLCPGYDLPSSRHAVQLSRQVPGLVAAVGVHPHDARLYDDATEQELEALFASGQVRVAGEMGLDYHYDNSPRPTQRDALSRQLQLARRFDTAVVIHNRESDADMVAILDGEARGLRVMLHAFDGSEALAELGRRRRFFFGIGGFLTFRKHPLASRLTQLPRDALLLETDAPYLSPHPFRGARNEPARIVTIAQRAAELLELDLDALARLTTANFARFLDGAAPAQG